ncbi:MAG: DUF2236 domain-containing protein [Deltaproteobacteria bacterium]|nr:DUF2236 domain-containing protein [Deltaproteobacteria bacterium]
MSWPSRVHRGPESLLLDGPLAERMFDALWEMDPLGDAAAEALAREPRWMARLGEGRADMPAALRGLLDAASEVPEWVDRERVDRAGSLLFRAGVAGGIVLGAKSLIAGYCAPAGNKPLAMTGQLRAKVSHRLAETSKYVVSTCTPGSLWPGEEGWEITLRVRLMHAHVRRLIERSGDWRPDEWGAPINQHDMVATSLLFSSVFVKGVQQLGVRVSRAEADDFVHLWRYASWLIGCRADLLPTDMHDAGRLTRLIRRTQGPPDDDSRALTHALLESPRASIQGQPAELQVALGHGFCRAMLGDAIADELQIGGHKIAAMVPVLRTMARLAPRPSRERLEAGGRRYWERAIEDGRAGQPLEFRPPRQLLNVVTGTA